jgi:YihY family inner membrane protein
VRIVDDTLDRIDGFQRRHTIVGFPFAVVKRYGEDRGGWLGAVISYYGFFALLPLLLAFVTILSIVLDNNRELLDRILDAVWAQLPFVGPDIRDDIKPIAGNPAVVAVALLVTLWGAAGVMKVSQDTLNSMWGVPRFRRPGFFPKLLRGAAVFALLGIGVFGTAVVTGMTLGLDLPLVARVLTATATIAINSMLTFGLFRLLIARSLTMRQLLPGALVVAAGTYLLTLLGGIYVQRVVSEASSLYGSFATIVGLLAWIALIVQVFVYGTLVNVVREERLWPRTLTGRNLGEGDLRAIALTMRRGQLVSDEMLEDAGAGAGSVASSPARDARG